MRRKQNEERESRMGMYRSFFRPINVENKHKRTRLVKDDENIRLSLREFEYTDVYIHFASVIVFIANRGCKLNLKCYIGVINDEECDVESTGTMTFPIGTVDHFDIVFSPTGHCYIHKQTVKMFNYTSNKDKLYLGEGDEVVWSNKKGVKYVFYTLVPFKEHLEFRNIAGHFKSKYHIDSVLMRVC